MADKLGPEASHRTPRRHAADMESVEISIRAGLPLAMEAGFRKRLYLHLHGREFRGEVEDLPRLDDLLHEVGQLRRTVEGARNRLAILGVPSEVHGVKLTVGGQIEELVTKLTEAGHPFPNAPDAPDA